MLCCAEIEEARALAETEGPAKLAGERRLESIPGFDFGNSPREVAGEPAAETLILSTTNGTRLLVSAAERFEHVYVGSLLNLDAVAAAARAHGEDVAVLCAGVLGELALDDAYCAGRIAEALGGDAHRLGDRGDPARRGATPTRARGDRLGPERLEPPQPRPRGGHRLVRAGERARRRAALPRARSGRRPRSGSERREAAPSAGPPPRSGFRLGELPERSPCAASSARIRCPSRMMPKLLSLVQPSAARFRGVKALAVAVLLGALVAAGSAAAAPKRPWLWQCEQIHLEQAKDACYVRLLLLDIDRSGDPATELPRIDARAKATPTSLYARCHMLMHVVGRQWAREHHLTLDGLQKVVPRSNDPGLLRRLRHGARDGARPADHLDGRQERAQDVRGAADALRAFTCVHSLGHALMRGYHETLFLAVHACSRLGARYAPDCEQGAFHDYWISLRGADDATSPMHAVRSPRKLCAQYARWAVQCWYRYWIEQAPGPVIHGARDLLRLCHGLAGAQREGCIAGAAKDVYDTPVAQLGILREVARRGRARVRARRREPGVCGAAEAGARVPRRLPAAAGRGGCRLRGVVRADVQRRRERAVSRGGCPKAVRSLRAACAVGARRWLGPARHVL